MLKTKTKVIMGFVSIFSVASGVLAGSLAAEQVTAETVNTNFQVNVVESLSVTMTTPDSSHWASGAMNTFLRNLVHFSVTTNNSNGFTATMYSENTTNLINSTSSNHETIPTLPSSSTRASFPANHWGYSYDDTSAGSGTSNYNAMVSTPASPITVLSSQTASTGNKDIWFGAKADATQPGGTYTGTVIFNVVTGVIGPDNPVNPVNPAEDNPSNTATYDSANNRTVYTTRSASGGTSSTTTEVSSGDTTGSYSNPAGVFERSYSDISNNTPLTTGLAVTATVAAASGMFFFILARRREDDEDEELEQHLS